MVVLITGGAGFIGSNLVRNVLRETEHVVVNLDKLTYAGNLKSLEDVEDNSRYMFVQADVCDGDLIRDVIDQHQPDAIMHLAAESHVDRSIDGPERFIQTNVVGTYNILQAALVFWRSLNEERKNRFRFLHVSTDEVYGSLGFDDSAFTESTAYDPHSPYSASKAASDHLARAYFHTFGLPVLITNCSNNYGPYQFPEKLIPVVILKCLRGESIPVYGKGENVRDWLYVEDHCRALLRVLEDGTAGQTYNIGGNNELKNIELVQLVCRLLDELHPISKSCEFDHCGGIRASRYRDLITFVEDRPGHDLRYAIDAAKIARELGWQPLEQFETGFRKTVQWYLANEQWWSDILSGEYRMERLGSSAVASSEKRETSKSF